jgi:hypothetical protein
MKKNYMTPTVEVIRIETQNIIAASDPAPTLYNGNAGIDGDGDYED